MKDYISWKIRPEGWLKTQLQIQAKGLSGNLDKVWPDVKNSAWIGGNREGWERVPYWLDGFIPLGFLLEDEELIGRAERYINAILQKQNDDGWICPCKKHERKIYDLWSHLLICKVLTLYCEFTGNAEAEKALYKAMKCLYELLEKGEVKLFNWGKYRWFEGLISLLYLNEKYHEDWIIKLGKRLREDGADWYKLKGGWKTPAIIWTFKNHIVNIAMMFKYEALSSKLFEEEYTDKAEELWQLLEKYHGTAVGSFNGDECLAGNGNTRGAELCSIVELMYSSEILYELTGNPKWAQRLEKLSFNALPATISEDMWTHQYDQQVNQIGCVKNKKMIFGTNNGQAHLFGLEPNYGCCTANFNQGWPKLALNSFLKTEKGIVCPIMLPASLETAIDGVKVSVKSETDYPFKLSCKYTVTTDGPVNFELKIRIPDWAEALFVNSVEIKKSDYYVVSREWTGTESFTVTLKDSPHLVKRPNGLKALEYGSLIFALPIEAEFKMHEYEKCAVERKYPYCDYELFPKSEWRYGFADSNFQVFEHKCGVPFSFKEPPVTIKAKMNRIDWNMAKGYKFVAAKTPVSNKPISDFEEKDLIPYGCAKLRMTEMPLCDEDKA